MRQWITLTAAALVLAQCAFAAPPKAAVAHYQKGLALKRAGKNPAAAEELRAAVVAYPAYTEAHFALGWVYRSLGKTDKAIESFREVIRRAPSSTQAVEAAQAIQRMRLGADMSGGRRVPRVALCSERDGNADVYVMDVDGGGALRLTTDPAVDEQPAWAPDAKHIAFVSHRDGNAELYIVGADGSGLRRVTDSPAADQHPVWSADGGSLLFESDRGGNWDVYSVALDGTRVRPVVAWPSDEHLGSASPDGTQLAIQSNRDGLDKVYVVNADGAAPRRLLSGQADEGRPVWRPASSIFFTWRFGGNAQVCRAAADGSALASVTRGPYNDVLCDVSADGASILIQSDRASDGELYLVEVATGTSRRVTHTAGSDRDGALAPVQPK
jgi:dipeptidyl aminopeptidase/acylaminoacyl peptidase